MLYGFPGWHVDDDVRYALKSSGNTIQFVSAYVAECI